MLFYRPNKEDETSIEERQKANNAREKGNINSSDPSEDRKQEYFIPKRYETYDSNNKYHKICMRNGR